MPSKQSKKDDGEEQQQQPRPPPPPQGQPPQGMPDQMAMMSAMMNPMMMHPMMRMQMMQGMQPWMGMMGMPPQAPPLQDGQPNMDPSTPNPAFLSMLQQQNQMPFNPMAAAMMMQPPFMSGGLAMPQGSHNLRGVPAEINTRPTTNDAPTNSKGKRARKKIKGKPKRPLSAYNLFFRDERERILSELPEKDGKEDDEEDDDDEEGKKKSEKEQDEDGEKDTSKDKDEKKDSPQVKDEEKDDTENKGEEKESSQDKEGEKDDSQDKTAVKKKTPHGKIGFESLAKLIGKRWQELDSAEVDKYKKLADKDAQRYKAEMEVFLTKEAEEASKREGVVVVGDVAKKARVD